MSKEFIIGIMLMWSITGYSQQQGTYYNDTVRVLQIIDSNLCTRLDSFIIFEKKCDYYSAELVIGLHIQHLGKGYYITIVSDNQLGAINNDSIIYGGFTHNGHYVEVCINPDVENCVKTHFFKETDKYKTVKRYESFNGYDPKTGIVILESIEDDSFSYWRYFYQKGVFEIFDRHSFCE